MRKVEERQRRFAAGRVDVTERSQVLFDLRRLGPQFARLGLVDGLVDGGREIGVHATAEFRNQSSSHEIRKKCHDLAWEIADLLREADRIEYLPKIVDVLLGEKYSTALERYEDMKKVIDELAQFVNPRYAAELRRISEENLKVVLSGAKSNAPGLFLIIPPASSE